MLKERVLMKNLQIKMEDNVQYKIETPDGRTTTWDAQKWQSKGSELMAKYPDAKVISIRNADKDTQFDDNSFVGIELSDGRTTTWDAQKWRSKGSELMAKYPDAKLSSLTDEAYNYNAKRAEEQRAALADFDNANSSFFKSHEADSLIASEGGAVGANYDAEEERYNTLKAQREKMVADYSANPAVRNDYTSNAKYADYIADSYKRKMQDLRDANRMSTAATAMYSGGIRENEDYHYYEQAYKLAKDASKAYAAPVARQKNGFSEYLSDMGKGAGKTFSDIDFWSRGLSAIDRNRNVRGIIQSLLDKGINVNTATESELRDVLTPGQVELLSAFALNAQAQADRSMTTARGYNAGITAAESLGFMAEFLLTGGIANSAGMAGREASTGLGRLLSRELMRGGSESAIRNGVTRSMINSFSKAGRLSSGAKKATKIASEVASKGYGYVVRPLEGAVLHTALHPSTYREISNSLTQINDSGELVKAGDVIGNTILDQLVENWSEMTGRPIDDLLGVPLKAAGALGKSQKFGHTTLGQWGKMLADSRAANIIQDAGFNGLIGEMGEEWIGNAARVALGIMSKDDFEKFASAESQIDMAASFAPMTLFGLGTSSYQASKQAKQYNKIAQSMRGVLNRQGMSEDEIANIMDVKHTKEEISQALAPVLNKIVRNSNDNNTSYEDYITTLKFAQAIAAQEVLGVAQTVERTRARQQEREDIAMQLGAMPKEVTDENGQKRTSYLEDPRGNISYEKLVSTPEGDFSVEVVTTATDSEGSYYVIEDENSDILMLKNQMDISRQPRLMSREEFNDAVENGEMSTETSAVGDYLDTRINARMEEQRRQALREQSNDALQNIMRHIKPGNVVNFGTNDNPQNGEVLAIDNDGAVVDFGQPTALNGATLQIHRVSLEQLGNILGIDASVRDEQQIDEEQAERDLENEDRVKSLNEQLRDVQFTRDGELFTFVRMFQAPQTNEQGEEVAHIVATNDKGEDVEVDVSLDDLFASRDEEGQPSLPEATQEPRSDNELIDIRGNVIPLRNNEATGQQEVDKRAFKERDPEAYYAWNDGRRGGNVQDSMQALNADMTAETARLAELEKLLETETDPDTRDDVQKQIDEHENKYNLYASIYQKYDAQTDYQNKQLEFLERFAEVNNELAKAKTQEQIDALVKIKSDLMRNYVAETINGATRIESAKNVIALQNAIGAVADTPFSVITEASVEEAMRKDGASEESINKVLAKLAEVSDIRIRTGKKFYATGFYNAGKVYVFVEGNTSEDRAIQTYYHERQHLLNAKDSRAINEVLSLADSNKDSLLQALGLLIGNTTAYHGANVKELADEIVAFGLERASIDKDFRQELRDKGISEGLINILYNEYAKQHGLSDSNTIRQEDGNADVDSSNTGDSKQDADFERAASGDGQLDAAQLSADAGVDGGEQQEDVNTDAVSDHAGSGAEAINQVLAIEEQRKVVDTDPTEAQKEAGNYRMGHVRIDGLDISIENPRGSTRKGIDADGHEWQTEMHNDYGYIRGTKAVDDDHIDVFLSDNPTKGNVYVIDQVDPKTGEFDESKVMYGFDSEQDASEAYLSNYEDGWQGLGKITEVSKEEFKKWIDSSTRKTKPFSEYASVKAAATKKENTTDNQGNPVNEDGTLKIDKIKSIDDLTDEDFRKYTERRAKENEERAKEERKQRLLSQPTRMDEAFGLIPVKDIKTAADITSNIEKITSILADNEKGITDADHPLSSYGGFIYGHNFLFNAQKQVENYVRSLDVIDSKITDEWKATTGIDNVEKLADYVKDLYKAKQTEIKPIVNGSAIYDQSYEKKNSVSDNTTDTVETDGSGKRNDTAIPQNTVSDGEGKQSSETKQISKEENRAPRIKKVNPFDFAIKEKNTQRPIFKGVYHDKGMLVATDTSILIAMKDDYPKELEGAVTFKDGHVTADVKFPDWRAIFDKKSTGEQTKVDITLDKLASYLDKIKADVPKKILTDEDRKASFVVIDFGYGVSSAYNYEYLVKFVNAARYLNAQVSYCSTGGSSWNSLNKKLIAEGTNGKVALFPVKYESEKNYKFNYNIPLNEAGETHFSIAELSSEEISNEQNKHKKAQLDIINATNPMHDDYHTGIREVGDIMTLFEAVEEAKTEDEDELSSYPDVPDDVLESALESGKITVYSSKPIKNGEFVTPSRMNAKDFAGSGTIYEKTVPIKDVAWINTDEGQYAKTDIQYSIEEKRLSNGTEAKQPAFDAAMTMLDNAGIPVEMLSDEAMRQMAEKTNALETVSSQDEYQQTVVSSASSAKVINNLDNLAKFLENEPKTKEKTFLGALAKALDAKKHGSNSQYATFETKNGAIVTIRLANHNAATSTFDNHGEDNGISIVISAKENTGINNDGNAHVTEFYYDAIKLRKAEGKPLAEIVKSIKQTLYSGEYKDTTGLAQVQEVNTDSVPELMTVYHGSGARNYVIFNEDDAKITDRIDFLRNGDVVYGAAVGGKILLNADRLNPNTPIHEYTHLWDKACQQKNPELWKRGVELMKQTSLWKEVENDPNYAGLNEDGIAGEVHARLTGNHGEETLERMSREAIDDATTEEKSNSVKTVIGKLREWLSDFWHWVKDTMTPWSRAEAEKVSVEDFINMPIADLAKGTRLYDGQYNAEERSIIEKAKSDGTYMKAPNGKPTNLDESQWVQVRTKAFKKWFGDWQKAARIEKLKSSKAIEISGTEIASSSDLKQYKKNALEYGKALRGEYTNKDTGEKISLTGGNSRGGIREILQHDYKDAEHLQSIAAIPQIIEDSIYVDTLPNEDSGKYPGVESFSYYVCGLNIGGRNYTVKAVIANQSNGERYYDHHLSQIEKGQLLSILPTIQKAGTESGNPLSGFKDKRLISILQTDSSKVVDENGEPKVVIHTTPENFTVFKKGERAGLSGKGIYFAVSGEGVPSSGGNTIHAFLNVRNPLTRELISTDKYRSINNGGMARIDADIYDKYPEFDGVMVRRDEITVKDPNQIKSATTNSGEFSTENDDIRFSIVTDKAEIDRLNSEPTIKVYRAMQLVDGKLYPPMSGKVNGKWRDGISVEDLGKVWEKAEENPELADDKGRFVLNKGNGTTLKARYNPYIHTSTTPLNDQFSSAQSRPELVTVEVEIPKSELTSGYKADKAKDRVGKVEWKAGVIQSKLSGTRTVILSRWDKPMRIVPESEVADKIVEMFDGKDVTMPSNVVTPALRAELEKRGVPFVETDNQGRIKAEEQDVVDMLYDEEMEASNEIFNKELQLQIKGKLPSDHIYRMGQPGRILLSTGVPDLPIQMNASRLKTKATSYGHDFELSEIKDLVKALQTPLAVFAYGDKSKAQNIIVPLQKDGKNFIVGLSLNPTVGGRSLEINSIRNVFPKNNYEWLNWISQGKALYLNKEKVQTLINQQRTILADVEYLDLNSVANIVKSFENPRVSSGNVAEKGDILPDDTRFRIVGGNSGYVGYSMSKRAAEAKEKGRFPKTQFVKEYGVPASHLDALVEAGIISNDEWHHTSKFGNKTTFYSWSDDVYQQAYNTNKDSINELAKQYNEADSLAKRREIASEIYDVIEHTDEVVAYREQEAKEYEERRNRVKWELTQRRELETQKKNELSHAREVMSGLSDKDEHIRKTANGYWYNADNQVSLQLSDDGRILNIRYPANTDNSQKKGLRNVAEKAFGDAYKTEEELLKGAAGDNAEESNRTLFSVAESSNEREKITESYNGLQMLGDEQCLQLLLKTFSALPESTRAKITKLAPANGYRFDKAVADYYSQLAQKETLTEEELQDVRTIRDIMKTALGVRHLSMDEVLWSLYNTANKGKRGFLAIANRTLVADKLGFLPEDTRRRDDVKNGVRFSIIEDAHSASAAQMYNKATSYWKNRLKESFVDMNESINDLVSAIEIATGENAKSFEDVRLALNQMSSKGLNRMTRYTSEYLEPMWGAIKDIMSATGMTYEDVVRYVMLKHAVERNDVFARRDARRFYQDEFDKSSEPLFRKKAEKVKMRRRAMVAGDLNAAMALDVEINSIEAQLQSLKQSLDRHLVMVDNGTAAKYKEFRENDYGGLTSMYSSYPGLGSRANYASEEEYNAAARKVRKPKYSNVADMETAARDEVSLFESKAAAAQFKNLWDRINAATKTILENQYKSNVLSKEQYEYARDEFNYYIPLRGFADTEADDIWSYFGASQAGNFAPALVSAMGRKSEAENPFNWIGTMASSAIAQNVKNEAKLALYYFITNRPNQDLATIGKVWYQLDPAATAAYAANNPNNPKKIFVPVFPTFTSGLDDVAMKAAYSQWEADMKTKAQKGEAYQRNNKLNVRSDVAFVNPHEENEHVIRVKVRGEDKVIYVNGNPRAAQAVNGLLNLERQGDYQKLFGPVLRWMSAVNTSYNPEFWISNFQRDFLFSLMSSTISGEGARSLLNGYINPRKMMKMLRDYEDDKLGNGKIESYYREFAEGGGITGYSVVNGNEVWEKEIKKYLEPSTASKILKSLKLDKCLKFFNDLGESVEQMSRFAAFVSARESGKSIVDAVAAAKEITVNFNRKGSGKSISWEDTSKLRDKEGKPLNASQRFAVFTFGLVSPYGRRTIMFFNAAIQGLNALYRLWQKDKRKTGAWFAGYFAVGAMMAILHAIGDDDDDYLDIPDYTRRSNVLLGGGGVYFKWAMPQEARAAYAIGDMVVNHALGRNPNKNIFVEAGNAIADVLPLSTNEGISGLLPSVAQPFWDLYTNEDYTGASIYNDQKFLSDAERASRPHYKSPKVQTGRLFINTSEMLNAISGGDEYSAGAINAYPESMQHVIESFGGGLLTTVNKTAETIGGLVDAIAGEEVIGQDLSVRRFPFLNRLLVVNDERSRNSHISDLFYYYKDIADVAEDKMRQMRKSNDYDALNAYQDSEDYEVYLIFRRFNKLLKRYDDLLKSEDDKDERKRLIREQDELRRELINEISQIQ